LDGDSSASSSLLAGLLVFLPVALGLIFLGLAAAAEMAFASVNRNELRQLIAGQNRRGQVAEVLLSEPARLLSTLMVTKVLASAAVMVGATFLSRAYGAHAYLGWWLAGAILVVLLIQILGRAWVVNKEEPTAIALAPVVRFLALLLTPITALLRRIGGGAVPKGASPESIFLSEDGLRFLLHASNEESIIEDEEKEMIASIFEFSDKLVREVMVPRIDVAAVDMDAPMLQALDIILKAGHSRIPVYRDSIDNVQGVLYAKDLLKYLRDGRTETPLGKIVRPAYFIPESKKVDELLQELQQRKVHIAVVVDEYGGTAGLVTIEDLLEEIVGEIQDEYDAEEPTVEAVDANEYLFDARVPIDEVNKLLGVELPTEGGDTLGGFIYSRLGKVPALGDRIEFENVLIEVLSVSGRRIKQVRATVTTPEDGNSSSEKQPARADGESNGRAPGFLSMF
jgi:CBS domain containing-hemolysin-like protein